MSKKRVRRRGSFAKALQWESMEGRQWPLTVVISAPPELGEEDAVVVVKTPRAFARLLRQLEVLGFSWTEDFVGFPDDGCVSV